MEMSRQKQKVINALLAAMITILVVIAAFYCSGFYPGKTSLFMQADYYIQYVHFIKMFWRRLLQGESLLYSFDFAMGMPTWAAYAYECLSPCNIFFVLIRDADTAAFFAVLVKIALSAAMMCLFLEGFVTKNSRYSIIGGITYGLCGYSINFFLNVHFLDAVYILPVLCALLIRFVKTGKKGAMILVYAYSFCVCFYTGYMVGIFTFVFWLGIMWYVYGKERPKYLQCISGFLFSVVCAILLSAVVTVPVIHYLFTHQPQDATAFDGLRYNPTEIINSLLVGQAVGVGAFKPACYSGLISVILLPAFFCDKGQEKRKKILAAFLLVFLFLCLTVSPFYLLMHGFDAPDMSYFRFTYMVSFVLIIVSVAEMERLNEINAKGKIWIYVVIGILISVVFLLGIISDPDQQKQLIGLEISIFTLIIWGLFLGKQSVNEKKLYQIGMCFVLGIELFLNTWLCATKQQNSLDRSPSYYRHWVDEGTEAMNRIAEMESQDPHSFYRVFYENAPDDNISMFFGYHGLGYFSTIEHPDLREALFRLGYATSARMVKDYGSTSPIRMLLGQRYSVHATNPRYEEADAFSVVKVEETLPLAYLVPDSISGLHLTDSDVFLNTNAVFTAFTGKDIQIYSPYVGDVELASDGLSIYQGDNGWLLQSDTGEGGSIAFYLTPNQKQQLFAYFSQPVSSNIWGSVWVGTETDIGTPFSMSYLTMPHILRVTSTDGEKAEIRMVMDAIHDQEATFEDMYFYQLDENSLHNAYQELSSGGLQQMAFSDTEIIGNITVFENKKMLFTSIPYEKEWRAYVDRNRIEPVPVLDGAFMALELEQGEHQIRLVYKDIWFVIGMICSGVGLVMLAGYMFTSKKHK